MRWRCFWVLGSYRLFGRCQRFGETFVRLLHWRWGKERTWRNKNVDAPLKIRSEYGDSMFHRNVGNCRRVQTAKAQNNIIIIINTKFSTWSKDFCENRQFHTYIKTNWAKYCCHHHFDIVITVMQTKRPWNVKLTKRPWEMFELHVPTAFRLSTAKANRKLLLLSPALSLFVSKFITKLIPRLYERTGSSHCR